MCIAFEIKVNMVQCTQLSKKSVYGVEIDEKLVEGVDLDASFILKLGTGYSLKEKILFEFP